MFGRKSGTEEIIANVAESLLQEVTSESLDEIRGHLTATHLRTWIKDTALGFSAEKCALHLNTDKKIVSAFLLTKNNDFLFSSSGKRLAVSFSARSVDDECQSASNTFHQSAPNCFYFNG